MALGIRWLGNQRLLSCGFSDLDRFSKDFAQACGERPSDQLKRRKDALAALH